MSDEEIKAYKDVFALFVSISPRPPSFHHDSVLIRFKRTKMQVVS